MSLVAATKLRWPPVHRMLSHRVSAMMVEAQWSGLDTAASYGTMAIRTSFVECTCRCVNGGHVFLHVRLCTSHVEHSIYWRKEKANKITVCTVFSSPIWLVCDHWEEAGHLDGDWWMFFFGYFQIEWEAKTFSAFRKSGGQIKQRNYHLEISSCLRRWLDIGIMIPGTYQVLQSTEGSVVRDLNGMYVNVCICCCGNVRPSPNGVCIVLGRELRSKFILPTRSY